MKQYPIVCPSCKGSGRIRKTEMDDMTTVSVVPCPACKGSGSVTCTETGNTPICYGDPKFNPLHPNNMDWIDISKIPPLKDM